MRVNAADTESYYVQEAEAQHTAFQVRIRRLQDPHCGVSG